MPTWLVLCRADLDVHVHTQQTTTCDFTCSVSEFTCFHAWIYQILLTNLVCRHVFIVKSRDDTYQWNRTSSDPVRLMSNLFKTRDNRQNTCIHMNTHENTYWWSGTSYEPVWPYQLIQKWFLVSGYALKNILMACTWRYWIFVVSAML